MLFSFDGSGCKVTRVPYFILLAQSPHNHMILSLSESDPGPKELDYDTLNSNLKKQIEWAVKAKIIRYTDSDKPTATAGSQTLINPSKQPETDIKTASEIADQITPVGEAAEKKRTDLSVKDIHPEVKKHTECLLDNTVKYVVTEAKFCKQRGDRDALEAICAIEKKNKKRKTLIKEVEELLELLPAKKSNVPQSGLDQGYMSRIKVGEFEEVTVTPTE